MTALIISTLHLTFAHLSNRNINLLDLNLQRAYYIVQEFLKEKIILDPTVINQRESVIFNKLNFLSFCEHPIEKVINKEKYDSHLDDLISLFKDMKYITFVDKKYSYIKRKYEFKLYTYLRLDAENMDILMAFIYSISLHEMINENFGKVNIYLKTNDMNKSILELIETNHTKINQINKNDLAKQLREKGWNINFRLLENKYMRYHMILN
jgi:hypothetical protein